MPPSGAVSGRTSASASGGHPGYAEILRGSFCGACGGSSRAGGQDPRSGSLERAHLVPQRNAFFLDGLDRLVTQGFDPPGTEGTASEELPLASRSSLALLGGYAYQLGGRRARAQSLDGGADLGSALWEVGWELPPRHPATEASWGSGTGAAPACRLAAAHASRFRQRARRPAAAPRVSSLFAPQRYRTDIRNCHAVGDRGGAEDAAHWCVPPCRVAMSLGHVTLCDGCRMRRHWNSCKRRGHDGH